MDKTLEPRDDTKFHEKKLPKNEVNSLEEKTLMYALDPKLHSFIDACYAAFQNHHILALSPDVVWATYLQSVAKHIALNAEKLRSKFVSHNGKLKLVVEGGSLTRNDTKEKWGNIFLQFREKMIGNKLQHSDLFDFNFSTSTATHKIAGQLLMMDAMKEYFSYKAVTKCGIPYFAIRGTKNDWDEMIARVRVLAKEIGMPFADKTIEFLKQFSAAFDQNADRRPWYNFFKYESQSGGAGISGNVNCLFPYLGDRLNHYLENSNSMAPSVSSFESIINVCPMQWHYLTTKLDMELNCGVLGINVREIEFHGTNTKMITPVVHWYMTEKIAK